MSMNLGGGGGVKSDINVTPLVDVMLVLLIIVMIVAPLAQKGVDVRLPQAANTVEKPESTEQTVLAITSAGSYWVNGVEVPEKELRQSAQDALEGKKEKIVFIKADEEAEYRFVMKAMDELRAAGIEDMGLITERRVRPGRRGGE